ncbi:MAG: hypothetical protein ACREL6_05290, partial [Gemmatimonadales bacterium]
IPDLRFNRKIGTFARKCYTVHGEEIAPEKYEAYLASVTPTPEDQEFIRNITKDNDWIEQRKMESA